MSPPSSRSNSRLRAMERRQASESRLRAQLGQVRNSLSATHNNNNNNNGDILDSNNHHHHHDKKEDYSKQEAYELQKFKSLQIKLETTEERWTETKRDLTKERGKTQDLLQEVEHYKKQSRMQESSAQELRDSLHDTVQSLQTMRERTAALENELHDNDHQWNSQRPNLEEALERANQKCHNAEEERDRLRSALGDREGELHSYRP